MLWYVVPIATTRAYPPENSLPGYGDVLHRAVALGAVRLVALGLDAVAAVVTLIQGIGRVVRVQLAYACVAASRAKEFVYVFIDAIKALELVMDGRN